MKIVYIAPIRIPSEKAHTYHIAKMCEALAKLGNEVLLLVGKRSNKKELKNLDVYEYYDIEKKFIIKKIKMLDLIKLNEYIPKKLHYINILIYTFLLGIIGVIYCKNEGAELVITRDSRIAYIMSLFFNVIYDIHFYSDNKVERMIEKSAFKRCKLFSVTTKRYKERYVEQGYEGNKIKVLPNGVDINKYDIVINREEAKRRLGINEEDKIIGYLGNFLTLDMEKGLIELIKSTRYIKRKDYKVVMIGGPMYVVDRYREIIEKEGLEQERFIFKDRVEYKNVPYVLKAFDCCVMTFPRNEHYAYYMCPLKMFEYMASKRVIITTDLPSIREILDEKCAIIVKVGDIKAIGEAIEKVLNGEVLEMRLIEEAYKRVKEYTWENRAIKMLEDI